VDETGEVKPAAGWAAGLSFSKGNAHLAVRSTWSGRRRGQGLVVLRGGWISAVATE